MRNRITVAVAVVTVAAVAAAPAYATSKPKPITKSYTVTLLPDPTPDVIQQVPGSHSGCDQNNPQGTNNHTVTVPAKGTLHVVLDAANPLPTSTAVGPDWDLYVLDPSDKSQLDSSHGSTSHEETTTKFKKAQSVIIQVCNLTGNPNGKVTYTFTYA